jgi:hypothetical protein
VKKLIAIFLLLQFVTNNTFAEELIKLPKLFTHFYHHSHEHHDSNNFVSYLSEHYSGNPENNKHQGEDNHCNLPFKHCDNCCINSHVPLIAFMPVFQETKFLCVTISCKKHTFENEKIKNSCASSIWQPPKFI